MTRILLLETSAATLSVALAQDGKVVAERICTQPRMQSSLTAPLVKEVMDEAGIGFDALDAVCVSKGPGSYTGLRVGVSTAKGIAFGSDIPLIAIDTPDILVSSVMEISPRASLGRDDKAALAVEKSPVVDALREKIEDALCDDLNTPIAIAHLFDAVKLINSGTLTPADKAAMKQLFDDILGTVMGLSIDEEGGSEKWEKALDGAMEIVLESRRKAREEKNWAESDRIRDRLAAAGITVKDTKDGATWTLQ